MKKLIINPIQSILLLCALALLGCNNDKKVESQVSDQKTEEHKIYVSKVQFEHSKMTFGNVVEKEFAQTVHTYGTIDVPPQNKAVISAFSGGYIKSTTLLVGDKVKKGDPLVTLENPDFIHIQQAYLETVEQLAYLKSEYERQKTMHAEQITSEKSFLKSESEYKTALARSKSLKKNLQMLNINPASVMQGNIVSEVNIYSPIAGFVTQVFVNTGTYVSPADEIMELINTDHLHLELKVFEKDLLSLKKGQEILFRVPETTPNYYKGEVHLVGTRIDTKDRTAKVHGHIAAENEVHFSLGMFIEADIVIGTTTHLALPEDAVVELEGKSYVLQLESEDADGYTLHPIEVKVESNYNGFTSFKAVLPIDGVYLTKGGFVLLQGE